MDELTITRTPLIIATEINSIKEQTKRIILTSSIEIGRRLTEAKSLIEYGEWGNWLKESVDYSQSTANNLMRIFEQYGADQLSLFGSDVKSQALGNLSYTQAVALLGIPAEEREQFLEENDIENMSTRELQRAIKELDQAKAEVEAVRKDLNKKEQDIEILTQEKDELQAEINQISLTELEHQESKKKISLLESSLTDLKTKLAEAEVSGNSEVVERLKENLEKTNEELELSCQTIKELEKQLKERPIEVDASSIIERIPEEVEKELHRLREKTRELESKANSPADKAIIKFSVQFEDLVKEFRDMLGTLAEIKESDAEAHAKYKNAVKSLIDKMTEQL